MVYVINNTSDLVLLIVESSDDKKVEIQSISPAELLKQHKLDMVRKQKARGVTTPGNVADQTTGDTVPQLGRGGLRGGFISLDMSIKTISLSVKEVAKVI
jgi:hypothetical protein